MNHTASANKASSARQGYGGGIEARGSAVQIGMDVARYAGTAVAFLLLTSCGTPGTASDPFYVGSDKYYQDNDPAFATSQAIARANEQAVAQMTQKANETPVPAGSPTATPTNFVFASDVISCAPVTSTVSEAVQTANGGVFPSFTLNGMPMEVSLDHNGQRLIAPLEDVMNDTNNTLDVAAQGDQVCFAGSARVLEQMPTPTPSSP